MIADAKKVIVKFIAPSLTVLHHNGLSKKAKVSLIDNSNSAGFSSKTYFI